MISSTYEERRYFSNLISVSSAVIEILIDIERMSMAVKTVRESIP